MKSSKNCFAVPSGDDDVTRQEFEPDTVAAIAGANMGEAISQTKVRSTQTPEGPLLVEMVPAEVRLEIFGMALQAESSVVNVGHLPQWKRGRKFNTALLTVSRMISKEAIESFYKYNVIRAKSLNGDQKSLKLARHVEVTDEIMQRVAFWPTVTSRNMVEDTFARFPNRKSMTWAIDDVFGPSKKVRWANMAANRWLKDVILKEFVDYGLEQLETGSSERKAYLKDFRLVDAVAYARNLENCTLQAMKIRHEKIAAAGDLSETRKSQFALWIGCFELWRAEKAGAEINEADRAVLVDYLTLGPCMSSRYFERFSKQVPFGKRVLDFTVETHGLDVVYLTNKILYYHLPKVSVM